jgi:D-3-phosphoglycerate dehydrogenase
MAEATIMLMLNLFYNLHGTQDLLRRDAPRPAMPRARMLQGKTIGLVGFGRIARAVAERLRGWNVEILACGPRLDPAHPPEGVRPVPLDQLLRDSDLVSLHTTLTPGSRHLIGAAQLRRMKRDAFLINTARGACVDEAAVHAALRDGVIAGAALDAFEVEPLPTESPLRQLGNVILTPHMAGHTQELHASFAPACVRNVEAILAGELPPHACNAEAAPAWRDRLALLDGDTPVKK